jgi:hypothetical protein
MPLRRRNSNLPRSVRSSQIAVTGSHRPQRERDGEGRSQSERLEAAPRRHPPPVFWGRGLRVRPAPCPSRCAPRPGIAPPRVFPLYSQDRHSLEALDRLPLCRSGLVQPHHQSAEQAVQPTS